MNHLAHYRILSKLGAGGMGEVFLAEDTRLHRKVALKVLLPELAEDTEKLARFLQEARLASALSHPNAAHIYEIGEAAGSHFLAMEYIEGETLEEKPVPVLDESAIEAVLQAFRGDIEQVPPMYSALKHQGRRLYDLARKG